MKNMTWVKFVLGAPLVVFQEWIEVFVFIAVVVTSLLISVWLWNKYEDIWYWIAIPIVGVIVFFSYILLRQIRKLEDWLPKEMRDTIERQKTDDTK